MNKLVYFIIIFALLSCKTSTIAQEDSDRNNVRAKIEKPTFSDLSIKPINPGTIHLAGRIKNMFKEYTICGSNYRPVVAVEVKYIMNVGSGIVNIISSGEEIVFSVRKALSLDSATFRQKYDFDKDYVMVVHEKLCLDTSQTVYQIIELGVKK